MKTLYVIGTCDTKAEEIAFVRDTLERAGGRAVVVDVSTGSSRGPADVAPDVVARCHPQGAEAVLGLDDRGKAVAAMGLALERYLRGQGDVGGVIGMGGGGNTSLVTRGMRALPIGIPKLMVSTVASGNTAPYVGVSDICMVPSITDIAGLNSINRTVLSQAAHALVGMAGRAPEGVLVDPGPPVGLTQFGVTTACIDQVRAALRNEYECMVFHATGVGGRTLENLIDSGLIHAVLDLTTTEIADLLVGGVLACDEDRFGAHARRAIPSVVSVGAMDMVNFGARVSVPARFEGRLFHEHNPQVTLMRTNVDECTALGAWLGRKINAMEGPVELLVPLGGISALDAPGQPFHDPVADRALYDALERTVLTTPQRRLTFLECHINSASFVQQAVARFRAIAAVAGTGIRASAEGSDHASPPTTPT